VLFVLDGSGSMQAKLSGRSKIEHARTLLSQFINLLPPDKRVGLATFGHTRKDDCNDIEMLAPIGSSHTTAIKAMERIHPKGMTPLTGAMQLAAA
jgi:Ca-activated chloride channel family protein